MPRKSSVLSPASAGRQCSAPLPGKTPDSSGLPLHGEDNPTCQRLRGPQFPGLSDESHDGTTLGDCSQRLATASKLATEKGSGDSSHGTHVY